MHGFLHARHHGWLPSEPFLSRSFAMAKPCPIAPLACAETHFPVSSHANVARAQMPSAMCSGSATWRASPTLCSLLTRRSTTGSTSSMLPLCFCFLSLVFVRLDPRLSGYDG